MPYYEPKTDWNNAFNNGQDIIKRFNYINENIKYLHDFYVPTNINSFENESVTFVSVKTYNDGFKTDSILSDDYNSLVLGGQTYPVYYKGASVDYIPLPFSVNSFNFHHLSNNSYSSENKKDWFDDRFDDTDVDELETISFYGYSGGTSTYKQVRLIERNSGRGGFTDATIDFYLDGVLQFSVTLNASDLTLFEERTTYYNVGAGTVKLVSTKGESVNNHPTVRIRRARYPLVEDEQVKVLNTSYTATENRVITLDDYNNNRLY